MKQKLRTIACVAAVSTAMIIVASCAKDELDVTKAEVQYGPSKHVTAIAQINAPVADKAYMEGAGSNYGKVFWEASDNLTVNNGTMTLQEIDPQDASSAIIEGTISPNTNLESGKDVYRSVYPATIINSIPASADPMSITLPSTQTFDYTSASPVIADNYMAAYTAVNTGVGSFSLAYKNLCTVLKISIAAASGATGVDAQVSRLRFASARGLSGNFDVTFSNGTPVLTPTSPSPSNLVELVYSTPVDISTAKVFYVVLPPVSNEGFVMQVWNGDGSKRIQKEKANMTLARSTIYTVTMNETFEDWGGAISVSPTQKVYFAGGNLQYNFSQDKWRFAHEQYSLIPDAARSQTCYSLYGTAWNYDAFEYVYNTVKALPIWTDFFCWGTSGDNRSGALNYHPANVLWSSNTNSEQVWGAPRYGYGYGPVGTDYVVRSFSGVGESYVGQRWDWDNCDPTSHIPATTGANQSLQSLFADWGFVHNAELNSTISDPTKRAGTTVGNTWRTLSKDEWQYVYSGAKRTEIDGSYKCGLGRIDTTGSGDYANGLFFIPDRMHSFLMPGGLQFITGTQSTLFATNTFTYAQFKLLESYGVVFLPACGSRTGFVHHTNEIGFYWSSSTCPSTTSYDGQQSGNYGNIVAHQHAYSFKIYGLNDQQEHITAAYTENKYDGNAVRLVRNTNDQ